MTPATPSFETLRYAVADGVATITLHRPDQLNAFTAQMMHELIAAFDATDADDNVRAVIVTGSGRAFCAGADLSGGSSTFDFEKRYGASPDTAHRDGGGRVSLRIFRSLKPVIAAVNGAAVGVGVTMQLPMDIRLASTDAKFGFVFARRGITPEAASSWFLSRVVGISTALEWCYTGRVFSAQEAHERGLVRSLHAPEDLLPAAQAIAREIAANAAPVSVAISRQLIWRMAGASHPMEAHKLDSRAIQSRGRSADVKEGVSAFLEKRPAAFPETVSQDMPDFFDWTSEPPFA
ncbi:Putative acyl-CoA hydratase, phenylacetic acid degradation [Cupriavidus taiwanensis]|uniref:Acyl-CoA hydratase, phenylacetic acid degradation n=1 Tax=Cupriavidus taiwanensis TaxID=164546 RepID=A0A976B3V0_9BURK|nr:crotonase/enoyl-CoA hydratase family protein [Cupriavidus taiwanensis]SOZ19747.1 Putative acyl-CoA hydratase, phenylacetic acid degradation [Cupriavidus taiwanensis]SOZ32935.1 Putative acyl-CoA hydratase, phenylacetic acid degradation [Cupriavidus taiwanensis]SOZ48356.1 Putative acyl-CoA hydratase, phenylacetic acid degradation [Cupriavidus taiwanensis]SOZ70007.1 Putative acyl-CoA hydratase, phenylacetic acid degradation [Cupriavidus taiwanensis]SOZ71227.1 Putative acyl-CoA hydratase, pheny